MANPVIWPWEVLKPQSLSADISHRNLRSPSAANGFTQVVSNSAGIWRVSFSDIPVYNANMIKCWRALDMLFEGQLNSISLPVYDYPRSPSSIDDRGMNLTYFYKYASPNSDGSFFSDGSGYQSTYTNVVAASNGSVGGTTISVLKNAPLVTLEPGQRFSINDRLYQIRTITNQGATTATMTVRPPFREAFVIGDRLEFDLPRVRVKLTSDTSMYLPLNYNQHSFPTLDFIEDL